MACTKNHAPQIIEALEQDYTPGCSVYFTVITPDCNISSVGCGTSIDLLEACLQQFNQAGMNPAHLIQYAIDRQTRSHAEILKSARAKHADAEAEAQKQAASKAVDDLLNDKS